MKQEQYINITLEKGETITQEGYMINGKLIIKVVVWNENNKIKQIITYSEQ